MSIEPLNPHYSFDSIPTVFDEEAMTALEMCGRLGKKVNEVITAVNGWNVPKIVHVSPTGDKTGELDRVVIQGRLDSGYAVHLSAGEYYLNNPLIFRSGYMIRGDSQLNTVLNCKAGFIDHDNITSVDHVEVRDIRVKGPDNGVGIDISRKVQGVETGGRYGHFMNVYITGYDTAVRLGGCWCVNFTHCRIEASEICVDQRGSCNHIKYDHCMFLGPTTNSKTSTGVKITAENGAENYGINFAHCEFERHKYAVQAYACIALNVTGIYVEGVETVFSLDSCPAFLCDGGYISYPTRVCNTSKSNTGKVFSKCTGTLKNLYVRVVFNTGVFYLTSTTPAFQLKVENINLVNDGTAECFVDAQHVNSTGNCLDFYTKYQVTFSDKNMRYQNQLFANNTDKMYPRVNLPTGASVYKLNTVMLAPQATFTAEQTVTFNLQVVGTEIGKTTSDRVTIGTAKITAGTQYTAGQNIYFTFTEEYRNLIIGNIFQLYITPNVNGFSSDTNSKFKVIVTYYHGEMKL